jgi:hypothetical protein
MLTLSHLFDLFIALLLDLVGHLGAISPHRPLVAVTQRQNGRNRHPQFKSRSGRTGYVKCIVFGRPCCSSLLLFIATVVYDRRVPIEKDGTTGWEHREPS